MDCKLLHTSLVAKNATLRAFTAWVDCKNCETSAVFLENVNAELVNACAFACSRNAANADANTVARMRQALLDNLLGDDLMLWNRALDQRYGLPKDGDVAL